MATFDTGDRVADDWSPSDREYSGMATFDTGDGVAGDWSASDREYMASNEGFHTVDCLRKVPVDRIIIAFPVLSLADKETDGRQQNHTVLCDLSDGSQSPT
jgi:hypothetical protein